MSGGAPLRAFQQLGLMPDAEARDIRRAYARALKKIDQAADASGFQRLRDAYEATLQFAQWREVHGAQDDAVAVDPPAPPSTPMLAQAPASASFATLPQATPDQLADAVTAAFHAALDALGDVSDLAFEAALRTALLDERLFGIEARHGFEVRVAHMLTQSWRPGQEDLLRAAVTVFDWSQALKLAGLGHAGAAIDRAMDERMVFDNQAVSTKEAQRRVLRMLCQVAPPGAAQIRQSMPAFVRLMARFPHWVAIMAPRERIAYWQSCRPEETGDAVATPEPAPLSLAPPKRSWGTVRLVILMLCIVALGVFMSGRNPAHPRMQFGQRAPHAPSPPPVREVPVTQARIDEIISRIDYKPAKDTPRMERAVSFEVFLDVAGNAFGVNLLSSSGDPALDAAVKAAVLSSKPFPPDTRKVFRFGVTYKPGVRVKGKQRPPRKE